MEPDEVMHDLRAENVAVLAGAMVQSIGQQGEERPAQPLMCWNIEADFGPLEDCRRQPVFHQFFQNYLLLPAANLQEGGKLGGKLDDAMIQKWRDRKSTRLNSSHQIISYA